MDRYPGYKDCGIEWIGETPSHWITVRSKYKLNRVIRPIEVEDEIVTCFRDGVVTLRKNRRELGFTNSLKEHGYQQIRPGDLVIHEMDCFAGAIGISDSQGKSTPVYTVIEPDGRTNLRFIAYLLREMSQTGKIESLARSIRERTTEFRWNIWSNIHFPYPPLSEQNLISKYLDKKTSEIDSLISNVERKIELLKEYRSALISQCVTRGLDPEVEMKDSGIEWIGEIPRHWKNCPLKFASSHISEARLPKENDIKISPEYVESGTGKVFNYFANYSGKGMCFEIGDTLLNKLRIYLSKVVYCESSGLSMGEMIVLRPVKIHPRFQFYLLLSESLIDHFNSFSEGTKMPRPPIRKIMGTNIPIAPNNEQHEIVHYLDQKTSQIDSLIGKLERKIELHKEYRQSLISNVVTGKVRVTDQAA